MISRDYSWFCGLLLTDTGFFDPGAGGRIATNNARRLQRFGRRDRIEEAKPTFSFAIWAPAQGDPRGADFRVADGTCPRLLSGDLVCLILAQVDVKRPDV